MPQGHSRGTELSVLGANGGSPKFVLVWKEWPAERGEAVAGQDKDGLSAEKLHLGSITDVQSTRSIGAQHESIACFAEKQVVGLEHSTSTRAHSKECQRDTAGAESSQCWAATGEAQRLCWGGKTGQRKGVNL